MKNVSNETFFELLVPLQIGISPRYPQSGCLSLLPELHSRFWPVPNRAGKRTAFVTCLLAGLEHWSSGFLWPRFGNWPQVTASDPRFKLLRAAGICGAASGAFQLERDESNILEGVLAAFLKCGCCINDDLFFIPDHGRQLLQSDHHEVVHISSTSAGHMQQLIAHMSRQGYKLPDDVPDRTFKRPAWM